MGRQHHPPILHGILGGKRPLHRFAKDCAEDFVGGAPLSDSRHFRDAPYSPGGAGAWYKFLAGHEQCHFVMLLPPRHDVHCAHFAPDEIRCACDDRWLALHLQHRFVNEVALPHLQGIAFLARAPRPCRLDHHDDLLELLHVDEARGCPPRFVHDPLRYGDASVHPTWYPAARLDKVPHWRRLTLRVVGLAHRAHLLLLLIERPLLLAKHRGVWYPVTEFNGQI
mmetsp:Transcript_17911/g.39426  ORF Transcript_17911/g.39426 Transcript_17911/m.39426 type:complete len:224 (+) Transcript_17911:482-1153(+)